MFTQITDYLWESPITNKRLIDAGWDKYRIVNSGRGFTLSMIMIVNGIANCYKIGDDIPSFDDAVRAAEDYDIDKQEAPDWIAWGLVVVAVIVFVAAIKFFF